MEISGFCIAVVQARTIVTSVKDRFTKIKEGPRRYETLTDRLDLVLKHLTDVEGLLQDFPTSLPTSVATLFEETLEDVRDTFKDDNLTLLPSLESAFVGSSSAMDKVKSKVRQLARVICKLKPKVRRVARARKLSDQLNALQNNIGQTSNRLQHLISVISNAIKTDESRAAVMSKIDEHHDVVTSIIGEHQTTVSSKMDEHRDVVTSKVDENEALITAKIDDRCDALESKIDSLDVNENVKEVHTPEANTPAPSRTMVLDLNAKDEKGKPATPEGLLKHSVLYGKSPLVAVAGRIGLAYGVLGMAGVGKTVALRGLGHDEEVKNRFDGGVYYMAFGRDATLQTAIAKIASIMTLTGASTSVQKVKCATSLEEAVNYAVMWFEGKICLYLLDDLWPAKNLPRGYFDDLVQLLRGSPRSRMVISTRSVDIASAAGSVVDFGPRHPLGKVSADMFMSHATGHLTPQSSAVIQDLRPSVLKILLICGGLPIALSVTGCAVSKLVRMYGTFDKACDAYAVKLEKKRTLLGDKFTEYGTSLKAAIMLSLEYLQVEFSEWVTENSIQIDSNIFDLYASLCVLSNQAWLPLSVLSRLWKLEKDDAFDVANLFAGMSLATLTVRQLSSEFPDEVGIVLHDLQLDFCQQNAMDKKTLPLWHARLLNGYLETSPQHLPEEKNAEWPGRIIHFTPRPWWSEIVPEDGYIHANLSRHLRFAGYGIELAALLLDGRWTHLRIRIGGILALETDFELLEQVFEQEPRTGDIRRCFELIFKTVRLSWGRIVKGLRVFQFHLCGRLAKLRKSSAVVEAYLKSIENNTPKPYLLPVSSFFPDLTSSLVMDIPVGGTWPLVICSPCGRYIACGAGKDIVIMQQNNGDIIRRMQGHESDITCIAFGGGWKKIVSGSEDGKVMVWEWDMSKYAVRVFERHKYRVTSVAITGIEGQVISSSTDKTLRIWNWTTSAQTCDVRRSSGICHVAVSGEGAMIAFGLRNGTLKVVDSVTEDVLFECAEAHEGAVSSASFSPKGLYLATGSSDKTVRVWNTRTWTREGECLKVGEGFVHSLSFSRTGKQIAVSSGRPSFGLWNVESGKRVGICPELVSDITSVSFTADGQRIVSGSRDGVVRIWDAHLGPESKECTSRRSRSVWGVAISQNGLRVASASLDGTVRLWDSQTGENVGVPLEGHTSGVLGVAFSPDGRKLVSASADHTLRLWDTGAHTQIGDPFEGHTECVDCVSFSFDGLRVASGSRDGTARIWNVETCEQIGPPLKEGSFPVLCVSESIDGCHFVSRTVLETIIWDRSARSIAWKSEQRESRFENKITHDEADNIIRSCGPQTPHVWPRSFPAYTAELYCDGFVYSNLLGEKTLLADTVGGDMPTGFWSYHKERNVFAAGSWSGAVAICKLIKNI